MKEEAKRNILRNHLTLKMQTERDAKITYLSKFVIVAFFLWLTREARVSLVN
jgi:hypothetical protein